MKVQTSMSILAAFAALAIAGAAHAQAPVKKDVIFVPTPQEVVDRMLEMADVKANDFVIDLGSGDGRIAITAAKKYGARSLGIDIDPDLYRQSVENAKTAGVADKAEFRNGNIFETDFSKASVLTMYLLESLNRRLRPTILNTLEPGTRVTSHAFDMGDWEPDDRDNIGGRNAFLWIVPAKVDGVWTVNAGGQTIALHLSQQFQKVQGNAIIGGWSVPLQDVKLRGKELSFWYEQDGKRTVYRGQVEKNQMQALPATASGGAEAASNWTATRS